MKELYLPGNTEEGPKLESEQLCSWLAVRRNRWAAGE